jgi:GntR family transcriptional repressor for pyruvate dehydrogenase complex
MIRRRPSSRLSDTVAVELEKRILEGSLKPGDRLSSERDLAVEMGVSRPSLREAIQKLVSKGLLTTKHGGGTDVTDRLNSHFTDPWQEMLNDHPPLQSDLFEFRQMLESQAANLAAERATDVDLEHLAAVYAALDGVFVRHDLAASIDADAAFHQSIAEAAHNILIGHLSASLMKVIRGHIARNIEHMHACKQHWEHLRLQHRAIWEGIREKKPEVAARAASNHIKFVRKSMAEQVQEEERRNSALRRIGEK